MGTQTAVMAWDESRSGAQIRGRADQRMRFPDTYPSLFRNGAERRRFLDGTNETPATRLFGEIPAPFPTVRAQVDLLPAAAGQTIDIALVDGGVNDIDVEDIIKPNVSSGEYIERWDGQIRAVGQGDVLDLLGRVRRKCPNAVILYFGFFAPLSYRSSTSKLRDAFKYETDDDIGWFLNGIFGCEDVNAAILQAQTRAMWLQGRWQYWTRQAVVEANRNDATRGPGVTGGQARDIRNAIDGPQRLRAACDAYRRDADRDHLVELVREIREEILRIQHGILASTGHPNVAGSRHYSDNALGRLRRHGEVTARADAEISTAPSPVASPVGGPTLDATLRRYNLRSTRSLHADLTHLDVDSLAVRVVNSATSDQNFLPMSGSS